MNLYILFIFFFSSYFINYVNGFSDASCDFTNSQDNDEIFYTYTWVFKEFQDFCNKNYFKAMGTLSEKFYSPIIYSQGEYYSYRFSLQQSYTYFNEKYLNIYLIAFQTDYEKQYGIEERLMRLKFEIYLNNNKDELSTARESLKLLSQKEMVRHSLSYDKNLIALHYHHEFCEDSNTNLVIRTHFYKYDNFTGSYSDNDDQTNFFVKFEQYFDSDTFSDIIFKFSCGSEIKASSMFLAVKSPHFKKLFEEIEKDSKGIIIHIEEGVSYNCFYKLLYFIYSDGKLDDDLSFEELLELYHESNSREINDLKKIVCCRILEFINENTWDELLLLGWKTNNKIIKNAALKFVSDNWTEVKDTDKMKNLESLAKIEWLEELIITKLFGV